MSLQSSKKLGKELAMGIQKSNKAFVHYPKDEQNETNCIDINNFKVKGVKAKGDKEICTR